MLVKNEESAWQKASASLDATAKIYGFRVDSVHSETFKFLGGLNRNKKDEKNENNGENPEEILQTKKTEKIRKGLNTLETNINKLNLTKYDIDNEVDPLFSVMTSKFNESSARGLLLNTIPLDENLNYILECKREDEEDIATFQNKEKLKIDKKDDDTNFDSDSLSKGFSEISGNKILGNNLKRKEDNNDLDESIIYPVMCANDFEHTKEGIKNVLKSFIKNNNIDDFLKLQICPELSIFRESRQLNTGETNISFINTFKEEIEQADKAIPTNGLEDNNSVINEEDQDNLGGMEGEEGYEELPEVTSQNTDLNSAQNNDGNQNDDGNEPNINISTFNPKNNETSLTVFRYEDLIERAGQFGTGSTQNLPEFMNFMKNFGKLDKNNFFNKGSILGLNKKEGVKKKKEEKNFIFNEENEVEINDFFSENRSKLLNRPNDYSNDYEQRKKIKCFFHFDKLSQFRLYTISGKTITAQDIDYDLDLNQQENNLVEENNDGFEGGDNDNPNDNDIIGFEKNTEYDTFYQNEKKVEKNFGKLYRKFDIRSLKKKIWISFDEMKDKKVDFKNIVVNMSKNMGEEELYSISTPTCFVCMLHLCNEKNLFIEQKDMSTFYIERDENLVKNTKSNELKRKSNDDTDSEDINSEN